MIKRTNEDFQAQITAALERGDTEVTLAPGIYIDPVFPAIPEGTRFLRVIIGGPTEDTHVYWSNPASKDAW